MDNHVCPLKPLCPTPLRIIYNKRHMVKSIFTAHFIQRHYHSNKSNHFIPFWIRKLHWNTPLYQLLLIFHIYIPHQVINLTLLPLLLLFNFLSLLLPAIKTHQISPLLEVWVCIFWHMFLYHILWYVLNKTQKNHQQTHYWILRSQITSPPHPKSNMSIPFITSRKYMK